MNKQLKTEENTQKKPKHKTPWAFCLVFSCIPHTENRD